MLLERREQNRYRVRATVDFKWFDKDQSLRRDRGLLRDISSKGMFIYSVAQPALGSDLQVEWFFSSSAENNKRLRMRAKASVVRVEAVAQDDSKSGFAIVHMSYTLHDGVALTRLMGFLS